MLAHSKTLMSLSVLSATLLAASPGRLNEAARAELDGVWQTVEVVVGGPSPQTFKPGATLAMFHGRHYSRVEVHAEHPRPLLKDPQAASADELRAVWGPFVAEAGTFEVTGNNVLTMQATVAKNPAAMTNGATSAYTYQRSGGTLTLTQLRTPAGAKNSVVTVKLVRVE
jgi:hypothetical protein